MQRAGGVGGLIWDSEDFSLPLCLSTDDSCRLRVANGYIKEVKGPLRHDDGILQEQPALWCWHVKTSTRPLQWILSSKCSLSVFIGFLAFSSLCVAAVETEQMSCILESKSTNKHSVIFYSLFPKNNQMINTSQSPSSQHNWDFHTLCICPLLPEQSTEVKLYSPHLWASVCTFVNFFCINLT